MKCTMFIPNLPTTSLLLGLAQNYFNVNVSNHNPINIATHQSAHPPTLLWADTSLHELHWSTHPLPSTEIWLIWMMWSSHLRPVPPLTKTSMLLQVCLLTPLTLMPSPNTPHEPFVQEKRAWKLWLGTPRCLYKLPWIRSWLCWLPDWTDWNPPLPTPALPSGHHNIAERPIPSGRVIITCEKCTWTGHTKGECIYWGPPVCTHCRGRGHLHKDCRFTKEQKRSSLESFALAMKAQGKVWNALD